jgi:CheY-like chemotaxis protein
MMAAAIRAAGRRVLVAEDEYLLAKKLAGEFAKLGIETIGPASTVKRALDLVERGGHLDGAVLDIKLRDDMIFPVAEALRARGVPFVFTTGYNEQAIPDRYKDVARYEKPFDPAKVARALFSDAG